MGNLLELAGICETAGSGDRELDATIWLAAIPGATRRKTGHTHTASGKWCDIDETRDSTGRLITVPHYTSSIDAAMTLVPAGHSADTQQRQRLLKSPEYIERAWAQIETPDGTEFIGNAIAASVPLAICAAALRARALLVSGKDGTNG